MTLWLKYTVTTDGIIVMLYEGKQETSPKSIYEIRDFMRRS